MKITQILRRYPGKKAGEIYEKVDEVMQRIAGEYSLHYHKDAAGRRGEVSKMGVHGTYVVRDEEVTIDLKYPMLVPGSMRQKVQDNIERKLDGLFA
jgi:hypothetical protein